MKKIKALLTILLITISLLFITSCSNDSELTDFRVSTTILEKEDGFIDPSYLSFILVREDGNYYLQIMGCDAEDEVINISPTYNGYKVKKIYSLTRTDGNYNDTCKKVIINENMEYIGRYAFSYLSNLEEVTLSSDINNVSDYAFKGCDNLKSITFSSNSLDYFSDNGILYSSTSKRLICFPSNHEYSEYKTYDGIIDIGSCAFYNAKNLLNLTLSSSVLSFNAAACFGASNVVIDVDSNNTYYSSKDDILYSLNETVLIYYPKTKEDIKYETISTLKSINANAFVNTKIEELVFNENLEQIDKEAILGNNYLKTITLPSSLITFDSEYAFNLDYNPSLETVYNYSDLTLTNVSGINVIKM